MEGRSSDSDDSFVSSVSSEDSSGEEDSAVIIISSDSEQSTDFFTTSESSSSDLSESDSITSMSSPAASVASTIEHEVEELTSNVPVALINSPENVSEEESRHVDTPIPGSHINIDQEVVSVDTVQVAVPQDSQPGPSSSSNITSSEAVKTSNKRPASSMDPNSSDDEDEDQRCPICLESWSGTGEHRLCSLACGHLFGKSCIERWIKRGVSGRRCPKCNHPCKKSDIRPLFATAVKVKEGAEEEKLQQQLQQALKEKRELELQLMRTELRMKQLQQKEAASAAPMPKIAAPNVPVTGKYMFRLTKEVPLGEKGGGRVTCFCPWETQLSVSHEFKLCGFGVTRVFCERDFTSSSTSILHGKTIRDMAYFPGQQPNLLLTASLDRSAKLMDYRCNHTAQTYKTSFPLWSCCWDLTGTADNCHLVSLGMTTGEVARFDMRKISLEPMAILNKKVGQVMDPSPVTSLVSVPPGYCPSLPRGALIAAQLNSCRIFKGDDDVEGSLLPFQPPFLCLRSEGISGHLLVSSRATSERPTTHTVYRVSRVPDVSPEHLFEPVLSLPGANRQSLMTRPCIASLSDSELILAANQEESRTVPVWSVTSAAQVASLPTAEDVLDICNISVNNVNYLSLVTDKKLSIYQFQLRV